MASKNREIEINYKDLKFINTFKKKYISPARLNSQRADDIILKILAQIKI